MMTDDFYVFDQSTRTLTGQRTKREFRLGDRITVVIAGVDVDRRQLNLKISTRTPAKAAVRAPRKKPSVASSPRGHAAKLKSHPEEQEVFLGKNKRRSGSKPTNQKGKKKSGGKKKGRK